ncbi:hypothetical protein ACQQ97_03585 [Anaerovoracaceae bacterium SGI.195]
MKESKNNNNTSCVDYNTSTRDTQCRKYVLVINHPDDGIITFTHEYIKSQLEKLTTVEYYCMSDEVGKTGNFHTHVYLYSRSPIRFSTIKNKFQSAHIEPAKGSSKSNRDYVRKSGKWENTDKAETSIEGSFEEYGDLPEDDTRNSKLNRQAMIVELIEAGISKIDIIRAFPEMLLYSNSIDQYKQELLEEKYKSTFRDIETIYIQGETETGKTRYVMEKHNYVNVFRITNYRHPFDGYRNQNAICFEEFRSSLPIEDMLKYLEGYPNASLPARYKDKVACYTSVYIISNIPLELQYPSVQEFEGETWKAFLRRINTVMVFSKNNTVQEYSITDYFKSIGGKS